MRGFSWQCLDAWMKAALTEVDESMTGKFSVPPGLKKAAILSRLSSLEHAGPWQRGLLIAEDTSCHVIASMILAAVPASVAPCAWQESQHCNAHQYQLAQLTLHHQGNWRC